MINDLGISIDVANRHIERCLKILYLAETGKVSVCLTCQETWGIGPNAVQTRQNSPAKGLSMEASLTCQFARHDCVHCRWTADARHSPMDSSNPYMVKTRTEAILAGTWQDC